MGSCKIIKSGILTSLQDIGRCGYAYYAIPPSGAMDIESAQRANLILANPISYPVIECTLIPPSIEFLSHAMIAVTGAPSRWTLNGKTIDTDSYIQINKGDILAGSPLKNGLRSYIGISGQINAPDFLGSCSYNSYLPSDFYNIKKIEKGDIIEWKEYQQDIPDITIHEDRDLDNLRIILKKGPEYNSLDKQSKDLLSKGTKYIISPQSNRMGARLTGQKLVCKPSHLGHSMPVIPGMIQLTPSGQMIVVLQDGQTTGGYPRIAYIATADLSLFNQLAIGRSFEVIISY